MNPQINFSDEDLQKFTRLACEELIRELDNFLRIYEGPKDHLQFIYETFKLQFDLLFVRIDNHPKTVRTLLGTLSRSIMEACGAFYFWNSPDVRDELKKKGFTKEQINEFIQALIEYIRCTGQLKFRQKFLTELATAESDKSKKHYGDNALKSRKKITELMPQLECLLKDIENNSNINGGRFDLLELVRQGNYKKEWNYWTDKKQLSHSAKQFLYGLFSDSVHMSVTHVAVKPGEEEIHSYTIIGCSRGLIVLFLEDVISDFPNFVEDTDQLQNIRQMILEERKRFKKRGYFLNPVQ